MSLQRLLRQPVTIHHVEVVDTDETGDDVLDEDIDPTEVLAYLGQGLGGQSLSFGGGEDLVNRETYTSDWILVVPPGTVIDANDTVEFGDDTFQVIGPPNRVWNPRTNSEHHIEARLQAIEG